MTREHPNYYYMVIKKIRKLSEFWTEDAYRYYELQNLVIGLSYRHVEKKNSSKINGVPTKTACSKVSDKR